MHLHLLGSTFKNNEELEMAVHEWSQKQETNLYKEGIFKPVTRQEIKMSGHVTYHINPI
jgi:hypothetical protein